MLNCLNNNNNDNDNNNSNNNNINDNNKEVKGPEDQPIIEAETSHVNVKSLNLSSQIKPQLFLDLDIASE